MTISIVDIVLLAIILIGAIIGIFKGTFKSLLGLFGWLISAVSAFFLTRVVANSLMGLDSINRFVTNSSGLSINAWLLESKTPLVDNNILKPFVSGFLETINSVNSSVLSINEALCLMVAYAIFSIIVFLGLFFFIRIIVMIFERLVKKASKGGSPSPASRFFGFFVGAVRGGVFALVCLVVISFTLSFNFMEVVKDDIDKSKIANPIMDKFSVVSEAIIGDQEKILNELIDYVVDRGEGNNAEEQQGANNGYSFEVIDNNIVFDTNSTTHVLSFS